MHGEKGAAVPFCRTGDAAHLGELGQTDGLWWGERHVLTPVAEFGGVQGTCCSPMSFRSVGGSPERRWSGLWPNSSRAVDKGWIPNQNYDLRAANQRIRSPPDLELAGVALLREAVALSQSGEELRDALVLLQSAVALERLLDHPAQLLRLTRNRTITQNLTTTEPKVCVGVSVPSCSQWAPWERTNPAPRPAYKTRKGSLCWQFYF